MPMGQLMGAMGARLGGMGMGRARGSGTKKIFKMMKKIGKVFEGFYKLGYKNGQS